MQCTALCSIGSLVLHNLVYGLPGWMAAFAYYLRAAALFGVPVPSFGTGGQHGVQSILTLFKSLVANLIWFWNYAVYPCMDYRHPMKAYRTRATITRS